MININPENPQGKKLKQRRKINKTSKQIKNKTVP